MEYSGYLDFWKLYNASMHDVCSQSAFYRNRQDNNWLELRRKERNNIVCIIDLLNLETLDYLDTYIFNVKVCRYENEWWLRDDQRRYVDSIDYDHVRKSEDQDTVVATSIQYMHLLIIDNLSRFYKQTNLF